MIDILITHYNRLESLRKCLSAFRNLDLPNVRYIVADDGSSPNIQVQLKKLPIDILITSEVNQGLASNINQGLRACTSRYILYCQEDFIPQKNLSLYLKEAKELLNDNKVDMCRLKANYKFPYLTPLSTKFGLIPKFSWRNFYYNTFQYSDNPFLTTPEFFMKFGYFLENVGGPYGENEYAIRIMKSKAKIAISYSYPFRANTESESKIKNESKQADRIWMKKIKVYRLLRACRLHLEYLLYSKSKRGLVTFINQRK